MKRNVLFVDPQGAYSTRVNTGLGYIASALKKNQDINFKVLDLNNFKENYVNILKRNAASASVDGVGVSLNIGSMYAVPDLLKNIKTFFPGAKIFIGGVHTTLFYKTLLEQFTEVVDFAVVRETEYTIDKIVNFLDDEAALARIPGVVLKSEAEKDNDGEIIDNLDDVEFPDYGYFESIRSSGGRMDCYPIVTSRGCPYSCTFCAGPEISGKKWRYRSAQNVVEELEQAVIKYKTREVEFFDDHFPLNKQRAMAIMEGILQKNLRIRFRFANGIRADRLDEELVAIMKRAGLFEVSMGIESGDPDVFLSIEKGETLGKIENAIRLLKNFDIPIGGSFIIGLPGSNLEKDINSVKFAERHGLHWSKLGWSYFTPYPGTKAYEMIKNQVSPDKLIKSYQRGNFTAQYIETKDYPLEERIIARSIASRIPPMHPGFDKFKLFRLFIKMELTLLKFRDNNLQFFKFNLIMLQRVFIFMKLWFTGRLHRKAYF